MKINILKSQFLKFLLAGGIAALVNIFSRILYSYFFDFRISVVIAFFTALLTGFILMKLFVFGNDIKHSNKKSFMYYFIINIFALLQTYIISIGLAEFIFPTLYFSFYPKVIAHGIGVIVPVFTSYYGHKFFSFRRV